jgi:fructose-bisphosphate aldolase, class II
MAGFCSGVDMMFDGSRLPLSQNIIETAAVAEIAHAAGVSLEGEIGFVGYVDGEASAFTDPDDAAQFAAESAVDAVAVSVGNVHLQQAKATDIDHQALAAIEAATELPLVIHGGSGISSETRRQLATRTKICKFNIGTELRMAFGDALRSSFNRDPIRFDRIAILAETHDPVMNAARTVIRTLRAPQ